MAPPPSMDVSSSFAALFGRFNELGQKARMQALRYRVGVPRAQNARCSVDGGATRARVAVSADGSYLALAGDEGRLEVWSVADLTCTAWLELGAAATSIAIVGQSIVVATAAGGFRALELQTS